MKGQNKVEDSHYMCRVLKTERENHDTTSLYLEGCHERFTARRAGQYATIKILYDAGWSKPHPFTISCAPEDVALRFTIKKAGMFTSSIPALKPGTPVLCKGPYGVFCSDIDEKDTIIMIAGGVGITPFMSVLRHFRNTKAQNTVALFWANKTHEDAFAARELAEMTHELGLTVIHTLSRDKDAKRHLQKGFPKVLYIPGYATREALTKHIQLKDTSYYLCGPPTMQDFVLGELQACSVDPQSVEKENFAYQTRTSS